jgi:HK97 family phage prohead protease
MTMIRGIVPAEIRALGDDEVEVVMSTGTVARDGHILVPEGAVLDNYRSNPIFLWMHDQKTPVGRAEEIAVDGETIRARVRFAPPGISADADKVRGLVKSGIVRAVSVGFDAIEGKPIDPAKPRAGQRFTRWELLECSFVSVPADPGAVVTARDMETEMPEATPAVAAATTPADLAGTLQRSIRSLWDVGRIACLLDDLGWAQACAAFETALEGDASQVPALLAKAMQALGEALITMTQEEVAELLGGVGVGERDDDDYSDLDDDDKVVVLASATPELKRFRASVFRMKKRGMQRDDDAGGEGEMTMADVVGACREHLAHHESAMDSHRAAMRAHKRAADVIRAIPGVGTGDENNSQQVQTASGTAKSGGSGNDRAADVDRLRRRGELQARTIAA